MKPLQYYIDNDQVTKFVEYAGDRLQHFSNKDVWDLITVLAYELAHSAADEVAGFVRMTETRDLLCLGYHDNLEIALYIFDGVGRAEAKALLMGLTTIACYGGHL